MKLIRGIEFCAGSREERLPDFAPDFPYIASRVEMDFYPERFVPWHWHSAVELFYMESGSLEYSPPRGRPCSPRGRAGQRPGQQQLFRQAVPGGAGLHPLRVPPQMAGSC